MKKLVSLLKIEATNESKSTSFDENEVSQKVKTLLFFSNTLQKASFLVMLFNNNLVKDTNILFVMDNFRFNYLQMQSMSLLNNMNNSSDIKISSKSCK